MSVMEDEDVWMDSLFTTACAFQLGGNHADLVSVQGIMEGKQISGIWHEI